MSRVFLKAQTQLEPVRVRTVGAPVNTRSNQSDVSVSTKLLFGAEKSV